MMPVNVCLPGAAANAATANRKSRCFVIFRFFWKPFRNGQPSKFVNSDLCDFASSAEGAGVYHSRATPGLRNRPVRPGGVQESSALSGRPTHVEAPRMRPRDIVHGALLQSGPRAGMLRAVGASTGRLLFARSHEVSGRRARVHDPRRALLIVVGQSG